MYKKLILAALAAVSIGSAQAVVVVNGAIGEDADGVSPFETLQAALDFATSNTETLIEIETPGPIPGATLRERTLNHPITIQAAPGFFPTLSSGLDLLPTTGTQMITLNRLNVSTVGVLTPLIVGTSITANECTFNTNPAPGAYGPAVTAAVEARYTTGTLTMTDCTLIGHWGLEAGRAIRDYNLTRCEVIGQVTDLHPGYSPGIINSMNWYSSYAYRMGTAQGFVEIQEPRTLNLNQSIVRGGYPLGWPAYTLGVEHVEQENNTLGPITATNTVFDHLYINGVRGEATRIGNASLPPTQNLSSTFTHCTFRSDNAWGMFYLYATQPTTHTFVNNLFDSMFAGYGIGVDPSAGTTITLTGDANAYHIPEGTELFPYESPQFEATKRNSIGNSAVAANLTNSMGSLLLAHEGVVAQAVPTIPLTLVDKDGHNRPMPMVAAFSDIGADEVDETDTSHVSDWSVY
jgi:hypothetical protein